MSKIMLANADPIVEWLMGKKNESEISEKDVKMWKLISLMDDLHRKYYQKSKVIKVFAKMNPELSLATCYRYWDRMQYVIGTTHHVNKNFWRLRLQEWASKAISIDMANEDTKNIARLIDVMIKVIGLNDPDTIKLEDLGRHTYIITDDPRSVGFEPVKDLPAILERLNLPPGISEAIMKDATIVEFEELPDEEDSDKQ